VENLVDKLAMLAVIVLPLLGRFPWLGRYIAYRAGTSACGRGGGSMHLFRVAMTFGRQASP
jgi:hypothetical protein